MHAPELERQLAHQRRGCAEKRGRYVSRVKAKRYARQALKLYGVQLKPYRCTFCEGWHLTTRRPG